MGRHTDVATVSPTLLCSPWLWLLRLLSGMMLSLSPQGRIIYHSVWSTKNNNKKKTMEHKDGLEVKANMSDSDTSLPSFIKESKIEEWLFSQGGSLQMRPPSFIDFLWARESFIGYSPAFLFTLGPTLRRGWEQLSVFVFAARQSKNCAHHVGGLASTHLGCRKH